MRGTGSYAAAALLLAAVLLQPTDATNKNKNKNKNKQFRTNKDSGNRCERTSTQRVPVINEKVCRSFADSHSAVYRHSVTLPDAPPGCFIFESSPARPQLELFNGIYFNRNTTGGSHNFHHMICVLAGFRQGAPPPPPDQRSWADEVQFCEGPDNGRLAFRESVPFNEFDACVIDAGVQTSRCAWSGWVVGQDVRDGKAVCRRADGDISSATLGAADCTEIVGGVWVDATCLDAAIHLSNLAMSLPNATEDLCSLDLDFQNAFALVSTLCCVPETPLYRCGPPPPPPIRFCRGDDHGRDNFIDTNFPRMGVGDCIIPAGNVARCSSAGFFVDGSSTCDSSESANMTEAACSGVGGTWSPRDCRQMQADIGNTVSTQGFCEIPNFSNYLLRTSIGCCEQGTAYMTFNDLCHATVAPPVTDPPDQNTGYLNAVYYPQGSNCTAESAIVELQYTFGVGQTCVPFPANTPLNWAVNTGSQIGHTSVAGTYLQISPCTHPSSDQGSVVSVAITGALCDSACTSCLQTFARPIDAATVIGVCQDNPLAPTSQQYVVASYQPACPVNGVPTPAVTPAPPIGPVNPLVPRFCMGASNGLHNFNSATSLDIEDSCVINGTDPRKLAACNAHFRVDFVPGACVCVYSGRVPMSAHSCETMVGGTWVEKTCRSGADHAARLSGAALDRVCDDDALSLLFSTISSVCCSPHTGYYRCGPPPPPPLRFCTGDNYGNDNFIDTNFPVENSVQCTIPNGINATRERAACVAAGFEVDHGTRCKHKHGRGNPDMNASVCIQIGGTFTVNDCQQEQIELFSELSYNNEQVCGFRGNADYFTGISENCCANGTAADAFQALCSGPNATVEPFTLPTDRSNGYFVMEFFLASQCRGRPDAALTFSFAPGETCVKFPDNTPEAWTTADGSFVVDSYMRISTCDVAGSIAIRAVFCTEDCSFCEYDYVQRRGSLMRLNEVQQTCQPPFVPGYPMFRIQQKRAACSHLDPVTVSPHVTFSTTRNPDDPDDSDLNNVPGGMGSAGGMDGPQDHRNPDTVTGVTEASIIAIIVGVVVVVMIAASVAFYYVRTKYGGGTQASYLNPNFGGEDPSAYLHPSEPHIEYDDVYEDDEYDEDLVQFE